MTSENPAIQGVNALAPAVAEYLGDGNPMLTGSSTVTLTFNLETAVTPQIAAKIMTLEMIESGLSIFTFEVKDNETGDVYYVRDGQVYTQAQLEDQLEALRDANGSS